ncbi:hypothetical protein BKA80DRAFT_258959 [Phyllosticta citrichinensis]
MSSNSFFCYTAFAIQPRFHELEDFQRRHQKRHHTATLHYFDFTIKRRFNQKRLTDDDLSVKGGSCRSAAYLGYLPTAKSFLLKNLVERSI